MDVIQLLPDSVANQIAAGEVIQRPASVIKELVENAVDAGAKTIQVLVVDAGRTSIQVIDDGCGMSNTDARLAFERHATSKIRKAADLFTLHTMGFRGEALPSIAAVAQVTLQTRLASEEVGTKICIAGCRVTSQEIVSCPIGSNFLIENLFFNVPARRKFMKSNATEMSHIIQSFERIVLVYPEITFELYNNGQDVLKLRAGSMKQRIIDVFGKRLNPQLVSITADTTLCKLTGFVGIPESAKKKGAQQYFFVNGRYMKHPYFHTAVLKAYERIIPQGEQVPYFLYMEVPPEDIDVNVHPTKTEIKFENEQAIWQILHAAVRDAVGKVSGISTLDFDTEDMPEIPIYNPTNPNNVRQPSIENNPNYNPFNMGGDSQLSGTSGFAGTSETGGFAGTSGTGGFAGTSGSGGFAGGSGTSGTGGFSSGTGSSGYKSNGGFGESMISMKNADGWEELYGKMDAVRNKEEVYSEPEDLFPSMLNADEQDQKPDFSDRCHQHLQYKGSYILTQVSAGLMITDQHRAHVRILFEDYMRRLEHRGAPTQKILFPETMQFPPSYDTKLPVVLDNMRSLGFDIVDEQDGTYTINGVPGGLSGMDTVTLVNELVSAAIDHDSDVAEEVNSVLALELAYRAATSYGEILSNDEMEKLICQLLECQTQKYTPDGRTIIHIQRHSEIERIFR